MITDLVLRWLHVSAVFGQHQGDGIEYHAEITKVLD